MDDDLRTAGIHLIRRGLCGVFVVAGLSLVRPEGEPWLGFAILYGFAFAAIAMGCYLLERAGAWPPARIINATL